MRFALLSLAALVLTVSSSSAYSGASGQPPLKRQTLRATVCSETQTLWTQPLRRGANITAAIPFVGPHSIETVGIGRTDKNGEYDTVEGSGFGVVLRISFIGPGKPVRFRVASVREECVRVRLFLAWR